MQKNLKIIFEDDDVLAVDKPSGMVVNRSHTYSGYTLQDFIEAGTEVDAVADTDAGTEVETDVEDTQNPLQNEEIEQNDLDDESDAFEARSGIVHRLDKDTSGIILIAKNANCFMNLQSQFKNRQIEKEYLAVVFGKVDDKIMEINAPIKRHPKFPFKYAVVEGGRESFSLVNLVKNFEIGGDMFSSLRVFPKTGRTHQIRVHLSAMNHGIVCDQIYCTRSQLELSDKYFDRLMLHALNITFSHPSSGAKVLLETQLPQEFTPYF